MDSMEVNKGIAAVLVVGIVFFLTGLIGDKLVTETVPSKPAIEIKGAAAPAASTTAAAPAPLPPIAPLMASADPAAGEAFAKQVCTVCHTFNQGGHPLVGPNLYDVVRAPHDHEAGFNYSDALEKFKGQPWTYEALNHWLFKPSEYAPGTRMTFAGIPNEKTRANVIAYLRSLSPNPVPLPKPEAAAPAQPVAAAAPAAPAAAPAGAAPATAPAPAGAAPATVPAPAAPATAPAAAAPAAAVPAKPAPAAPAGTLPAATAPAATPPATAPAGAAPSAAPAAPAKQP